MIKIIDIITVNFNDEFHIKKNILNYDKISRFHFNWIIGDNSGTLDKLDNSRIKVYSGLNYSIFDHPALHHTHTLNTLYKHTTSDIVVVTDPDFYIYNADLFYEAINEVISNDLFIMGVPWHPKWARKYSNFPAIHFMIINKNASTYDEALIDFRPSKVSFNFINGLFNKRKLNLLNRFFYILRRSSAIYSDGDTGSRIYYFRSKIKYNLLPVLIQKNENYLEINNSYVLFFDKFFRIKYLPLNYSYLINYTISNSCEFFLLNNQLFGFHFRGNTKISRDKSKEVMDAELLLSKKIDV